MKKILSILLFLPFFAQSQSMRGVVTVKNYYSENARAGADVYFVNEKDIDFKDINLQWLSNYNHIANTHVNYKSSSGKLKKVYKESLLLYGVETKEKYDSMIRHVVGVASNIKHNDIRHKNSVFSTRTNGNGEYRVVVPQAGRYFMIVEVDIFKGIYGNWVYIDKDEEKNVKFEL